MTLVSGNGLKSQELQCLAYTRRRSGCQSSNSAAARMSRCDSTYTEMPSDQTFNNRPFRRRKSAGFFSQPGFFSGLFIAFFLLIAPIHAAYINFENCLPDSLINSDDPKPLQFTPLWVNATYLRAISGHHLNLTILGNVSGQAYRGDYPPPNDPSWSDPNETFGKIVNITNNTYTTLFAKYNYLTYTPYNLNGSKGTQFCRAALDNTRCPVGPAFFANPNNPSTLPGFSTGNTFGSSYAFGTLVATIRVQSGDKNDASLACISADITPDLGSKLSNLLTYLPVVILVFVAFATIFAAMFSPWGSLDLFRWTSNYGRDADLLRLVTPGFGDCLQYIQFIVLSGSLSLLYPGFFQPVVSNVSWSALMFNQSFVSHGPGTQNPVDGIYVTNSTYGIGTMSQLVGMSEPEDLWAGMVIWVLVIIAFAFALCQIAFLARFVLRMLVKDAKEDLRSKNLPFTGGMLVRVVCNFFLLPIVSLTMFQLVLGRSSPAYVIAMAVVLLVALLAFAAWILRLIFKTDPRSTLFDDLPTVLLYGPLYNTYSDDAAPFALIPALLTFIRGVAIGAVQPSGIAQLVVLAICEVILILTLHAFRPFHAPTSMNAYHTSFASVRLAVVLLMVAFVPSMGVTGGAKGWIGYAILLLHAIVLVFGFFFSAVQRIIEVGARLAGAGGEGETGAAARGGLGVLGVRQLSRRRKRTNSVYRDSMRSDAPVLTDDADADVKSGQFGTSRSRSQSGNSAMLLNKQQSRTYSRLSSPMDQAASTEQDIETPYEQRSFSFLSGPSKRPDLGPQDPYFRAPRPRRQTGDLTAPGAKSRSSWISGDWANRIAAATGDSPEQSQNKRDSTSWPLAPLSPQGPGTSTAYRSPEEIEAAMNEVNVDYAVRESDFYYGVRGPALSSQATRKLKTGPADPVGPASSASGWFKGIFSRKNKDSGKGFEVVRSSRVPLQKLHDGEVAQSKYPDQYQDSPQPHADAAYLPGQQTRTGYDEANPEQAVAGANEHEPVSPIDSDAEADMAEVERDVFGRGRHRVSDYDTAPSLGNLDLGGELELPSRFNSHISRRVPSNANSSIRDLPPVPRKSSRRLSNSPSGHTYPRLSTTYEGSRPASTTPPVPAPRLPFTSPTSTSARHNRTSTAESLRYSVETYDDYEYGGGAAGDYHVVGGSVRSQHRPTLSNAAGGLAPPSMGQADRPTSVGFVNQYRAGESMHAGLGMDAHAGSSAEVIEEPLSAGVRRRTSIGPGGSGGEREERGGGRFSYESDGR